MMHLWIYNSYKQNMGLQVYYVALSFTLNFIHCETVEIVQVLVYWKGVNFAQNIKTRCSFYMWSMAWLNFCLHVCET